MQAHTLENRNFSANPEVIRMDLIQSPAESRTYSREFFASLKQSNATQNIYFSNYIEWQGAMRERWFFEEISQDMLQNTGVFVTKRVEHNYLREGFPFQTIRCELNTANIQKCSFTLVFRFFIDSELLGEGRQRIAFLNHQKKPTKLPNAVLDKLRSFEEGARES